MPESDLLHHFLSPGGWSVWRWICVRGAGFPASLVLPLASPATFAAITAYEEATARVAALQDDLVQAIEPAIAAASSRPERKAYLNASTTARRGDVVALPAGAAADLVARVGAYNAVVQAAQSARAHADATLFAEQRRVRDELRAQCADPRFREAITWQNRPAISTCLDPFLRKPPEAATSPVRKYERLVGNYLQRYCLKNDTIGFFGPVGWARIGQAADLQLGPNLLATRTVFFEHWAIDAIASQFAADEALLPHLCPRLRPSMRIEGTTLHHPVDRQTELPVEYARIAAACDGERTAREVAALVLQDVSLGLSGEDEAFQYLHELEEQGAIIWTLEVPAAVEHPDKTLQALLARVPDPAVVSRISTIIAELQAVRDDVARAAGDPAALDAALVRLEQVFETHAQTSAHRRGGATYAGRSIVFEDCRRDLTLTLPPEALAPIAPALSLVLDSSRWYTYTIARRFRDVFVALYRELARETGSAEVDFLRFMQRASDHFANSDRAAAPIVTEVVVELQRRWQALLELSPASLAERQIRRRATDLAARAADLFAAPHPGWPSARHKSPDLMVAASDVAAVSRGDALVVLGELHSGMTLAPAVARHHPRPSELDAAHDADLPAPRIAQLGGKEQWTRANAYSTRPQDLDLQIGVTRSWRPRSHVVNGGSLVVVADGDDVRVCTRDRSRTFALEEIFDSSLGTEALAHFKPLPPAAHCPRVSIDNLVLSRESWRFAAADLTFAAQTDPVLRLAGVQQWARQHGLPRFVFYRVPQEIKPCYLDLESPLYIEQFVHLAKAAPHVSLSEMLPAVDQVWLPDAQGNRYTCELRVVTVDPLPWPAR